MRFDFRKFMELTGKKQIEIATILKVDPTFINKVYKQTRTLTVHQVLTLKEIFPSEWYDCCEEEARNFILHSGLNKQMWKIIADGVSSKTVSLPQDKIETLLAEKEQIIEQLKIENIKLKTEIEVQQRMYNQLLSILNNNKQQ